MWWILISHATATWLGLVKVLCKNKVPKIKRQVASVTKKQPYSNKNICLSGPIHPPKVKYTGHNNKTVTKSQQEGQSPSSAPHGHRRRCPRGKPHDREEGRQEDLQSVKSH